MEELDPTIVAHLQALARGGATASQMLRYLFRKFAPEAPHKITLIKYMRKAFDLTLQEASPIAGWSADGTGDLSDAQVDELVVPEIRDHEQEWDRVQAG
jgi:hypothetical protein